MLHVKVGPEGDKKPRVAWIQLKTDGWEFLLPQDIAFLVDLVRKLRENGVHVYDACDKCKDEAQADGTS